MELMELTEFPIIYREDSKTLMMELTEFIGIIYSHSICEITPHHIVNNAKCGACTPHQRLGHRLLCFMCVYLT